ncbi:MAG: hypothetical protein O2868_16785 [Proteobacteria bacterium]|nr:hypothetical protein [Pseudomonadota bacterium]
MMRLSMILAVARAEMRSNRRLARYWLFVVLAFLVSTVMFGQFTVLHGLFSHITATLGAMGPRYMISVVGLYMMLVFVVGLIFLAFDVRARDERDRMAEVLDTRAVSNAEYVVGSLAGLVLMIWIPVLVIGFLAELFGLVANQLALPIGDPIEPVSLVGFFFQTLTALTLWCSILVLFAVLFRNRLLTGLAALVLLGLQVWATFNLPIYQVGLVTILPSFELASDLLPILIPRGEEFRMLSHWLLAGGLLALTVALHPRSDGQPKPKTLGISAAFGVLALLSFGYFYLNIEGDIRQDDTWLAAHQAKADQPRVDVLSMSGTLHIEPGSNIDLDLEMQVIAPAGVNTLLFTFNPGIEIQAIELDGNETDWTHSDGLLEISGADQLEGKHLIHLTASGAPDERFGYLDTAFRFFLGDFSSSQIALLGYQISLFRSGYVAMMPGAHWLPSSGTDVGRDDPSVQPPDYFNLDLEVAVPEGWLVAGPGVREQIADGRFRFRPEAVVPRVALFASRFARRSMSAHGIEVEMLVHPKHLRNLDFFADTTGLLHERVESMLAEADDLGLAYPYDGLTLVETPTPLRGYGGGWQMDTTQTQPGILLIRESSFPTSRFESEFLNTSNWEAEDIHKKKLEVVTDYFSNDFSGGNVFTGGVRNVLQFQTSAIGDGAQAVNFVLNELASLLLTGERGYFSAHQFDSSLNAISGQVVQDMALGRADSVTDAVIRTTTNRAAVWDMALGEPLAEMDVHANPGMALNVLALKSNAVARAILDGYGREATARFLSALLQQHRGGYFTAQELEQVAIEAGINLDALVGDWLYAVDLPGFIASPPMTQRLTDDALGNPRYQTTVKIRNDEPVPGLFRLNYVWGEKSKDPDAMIRDKTAPIRIPGHTSVEVGVLTATPVMELHLDPYLSLNREPLKLAGYIDVDSRKLIDAEPLIGARNIDWQPDTSGDIIVDDLDPGFSVQGGPDKPRFAGDPFNQLTIDMDQGLPEYRFIYGPPTQWSRSRYSDSWGKYRHTHAVITNGEGNQRATFAASLPASGQWRLSYYLAVADNGGKSAGPGVLTNRQLGEYKMALIDADGERREIEFDGKAAGSGWNDLGEFTLPAGHTRLEIANSTTGQIIVADAIRWRRASNEEISKRGHDLDEAIHKGQRIQPGYPVQGAREV